MYSVLNRPEALINDFRVTTCVGSLAWGPFLIWDFFAERKFYFWIHCVLTPLYTIYFFLQLISLLLCFNIGHEKPISIFIFCLEVSLTNLPTATFCKYFLISSYVFYVWWSHWVLISFEFILSSLCDLGSTFSFQKVLSPSKLMISIIYQKIQIIHLSYAI